MARTEIRTTRIELRTQPRRAQRIRYAARLTQKTMSGFMLDAASDRAEEVISSTAATALPGKFFDELWAALAEPPKPNAALARLARARRRLVQK
jgi:uncharacterized protein (DUF1778 family)